MDAGSTIDVGNVGPVARQPAYRRELTSAVDRGHAARRRDGSKMPAMGEVEAIGDDDDGRCRAVIARDTSGRERPFYYLSLSPLPGSSLPYAVSIRRLPVSPPRG